MATHVSAEKRHRQSLKKKARNIQARSKIKTAVKGTLSAVEGKKKEEAEKKLRETISMIAKAGNKKLYHKKTAQRKISRLAKRLQSIK